MKQKVQTVSPLVSVPKEASIPKEALDYSKPLDMLEAMAVIQFLDVRGKLCSHCGFRRATGSSVYSRVCDDCRDTAKGSAFKPLIGAEAITTKLDDFLLKKLAAWVGNTIG